MNDPFGKITPPPGSQFIGTNPAGALGTLIVNGIKLVLVAAGLLMLIYLLWGGIDWITSGGDKEKVAKARQKLTNAIVGMFVVIAALAVFTLVTGNILGILCVQNGAWTFHLPVFGQNVPGCP